MTDDEKMAEKFTSETYGVIRRAVADELLIFHKAVTMPLLENQAEIMKSLGLVVDGQTLVEKTLASLTPDDDEPWRESLD